mmetsp:Transcript_21808/g.67747  ORF Transcript_21808/g.67747 Transcript_21808/m.67747 type:complete len:221 (+) Transcript_21808:366-1028(+)
MAPAGRECRGAGTVVAPGLELGPALGQQPQAAHLAALRGLGQGRGAVLVLRLEANAALTEQPDTLSPAAASSQHERSGAVLARRLQIGRELRQGLEAVPVAEARSDDRGSEAPLVPDLQVRALPGKLQQRRHIVLPGGIQHAPGVCHHRRGMQADARNNAQEVVQVDLLALVPPPGREAEEPPHTLGLQGWIGEPYHDLHQHVAVHHAIVLDKVLEDAAQ